MTSTLQHIAAIAKQALAEQSLGPDYLAAMMQDIVNLAEEAYPSNADPSDFRSTTNKD